MNIDISADKLALQRLYHWETTAPHRVVLTQPMGSGVVSDFSWKEVVDQSRRMAAHLQSQGIQPGDRVALISKNTAHWLMSDFAIWMAGGVSVPLYPTLAAGTIRQILDHVGPWWHHRPDRLRSALAPATHSV
jgi:long-chain acyl-CoA synthetase